MTFDAIRLADFVAVKRASGLTCDEVKKQISAKAGGGVGLDLRQNSGPPPPPKGIGR